MLTPKSELLNYPLQLRPLINADILVLTLLFSLGEGWYRDYDKNLTLRRTHFVLEYVKPLRRLPFFVRLTMTCGAPARGVSSMFRKAKQRAPER